MAARNNFSCMCMYVCVRVSEQASEAETSVNAGDDGREEFTEKTIH